jgi:hypothetical protein
VEHGLRLIYTRTEEAVILAELMDLMDRSDKLMHEPVSWHTTCLYIGNDMSKLDSPIYKNFIEGVQVDLKVATFVYIPGKIIAAPVFPDYKYIENKFPHITLFTGTYSAADSNSVLKAVFGDNAIYKSYYDGGLLKKDNWFINDELSNVEITLTNGTKDIAEKVYILKFEEFRVLDAVTKKNYAQ